MVATIDDTNSIYVEDQTPSNESVYRSRFYLRPDGLTMASGNKLDVLMGFDNSLTEIFRVQLRLENGVYQIRAQMKDGDDNWKQWAFWDLFDGWNAIEIMWDASGKLTVWVNDTQVYEKTSFTATTARLETVRFGALGIDSGTTGTLSLDAFDSHRVTYIGLDSTLAIDPVFADSFESEDMTAWSSNVTDAGDLDVVALESPIGTFGLEATLDDTNALYVQDDSPDEEDLYRGRVYLRPEGLTIGTGETLLLLSGKDTAGTSLFQLQVQQTAGVYQVKAFMLDGDNNIFTIGWMDLHKEWNAIEISWKASGELTLWVNDTQAGQLSGQTATPLRLDKVRLGALSVETGTSGSLYLTAYESRRDSKIALASNIPLGTVLNARYYYDGDGNQVKSVVNGVTTYYVGGSYELQDDGTDTTVRKYYGIGLQKVAMRTQVNSDPSTVNWLLGDHLGSTSLIANADGTELATVKYSAFGKVRESSGTSPTDYLYTGQRNEAQLGLYYYVARWYDPEILHFAQADTDVPGSQGVQGFNRYSYVNNNPIRYNDPTGHIREDGATGSYYSSPIESICYHCFWNGGNSLTSTPSVNNAPRPPIQATNTNKSYTVERTPSPTRAAVINGFQTCSTPMPNSDCFGPTGTPTFPIGSIPQSGLSRFVEGMANEVGAYINPFGPPEIGPLDIWQPPVTGNPYFDVPITAISFLGLINDIGYKVVESIQTLLRPDPNVTPSNYRILTPTYTLYPPSPTINPTITITPTPSTMDWYNMNFPTNFPTKLPYIYAP